MVTQLQETEWTEPRLRQRLEPELQGLRQAATLGDIVTATGLPAERTEPVLRRMLDEYDGRLAVDERGELLYSFPRGLRVPHSYKDALRALVRTLWRWFKVAYKVGIFVVLIVYFLIFLVIMIALLVAAASASDSDLDIDLDGCDLGCMPVDLIWFMPGPTTRHTPQRSFRAARPTPYQPRPKAENDEKKVPPWLLAYEFVFGPEPTAAEPLEEERRLLAYIRDRKGRVTASDIIALTGCSLDEAEAKLLHLMVAHGGDVEVSDEGTLIYTFDRLMLSAGEAKPQQSRLWSWWWERHETPGALNRNSTAANVVLSVINAFNLAWSSFFTFSGIQLLREEFGATAGTIAALLGPVGFAFSALFFVIPLVRGVLLNRENAQKERRNQARTVGERVFRRHITSDEVDLVMPDDLARGEGRQVVTGPRCRELVEDLAVRWDGDPDADADGHIGYRFPRLRQEWRDVAAAREAVDPEQFRLGDIAYDSDQGD